MRPFCPKCGRLAEYDPYYMRVYCTACDYRSEKMCETAFHIAVESGDFRGKRKEESACTPD